MKGVFFFCCFLTEGFWLEVSIPKKRTGSFNKKRITSSLLDWLVLSDEQMSKRWQFSLLNDEQMSNWLGVKHLPVDEFVIFKQLHIYRGDIYQPC